MLLAVQAEHRPLLKSRSASGRSSAPVSRRAGDSTRPRCSARTNATDGCGGSRTCRGPLLGGQPERDFRAGRRIAPVPGQDEPCSNSTIDPESLASADSTRPALGTPASSVSRQQPGACRNRWWTGRAVRHQGVVRDFPTRVQPVFRYSQPGGAAADRVQHQQDLLQARASRSSSPISASPMPRRRARRCTSIFATSARGAAGSAVGRGAVARYRRSAPPLPPPAAGVHRPPRSRRRRARKPAPAPAATAT